MPTPCLPTDLLPMSAHMNIHLCLNSCICVLKSLEAIFAICCISGLFFEGREIGRALFSDQSMLWPSEKKIQKHGNPD